MRDGETTVIGGMMKVNKSHSSQGVPMISTIPILGWLFKNKTKSKTDNELLIFITPRIIRHQGQALQVMKSPPLIPEKTSTPNVVIQSEDIIVDAVKKPKNKTKGKYRN
ncbi:MAG: hypothetical protein ACD_73C00071G0005 [uncultured bacterium]|nr:MAG: hypothetical protein ACD_73C00071G0005 [uncultured bacterium]